MSKTAQMLATEFEALKNELIAKHDELGMQASGQWSESLTIEVSEKGALLTGADYSNPLESGRKPGKQPPSEAIEQWIKDKGIAARLEKEISISSLAFLIARKISREGWNRNRYGGVELISSVITPERIQAIIDRIGESQLNDFTSSILTHLKTTSA